jgi:Zn-dependent protease with chaperone function
MGDTMSENTPDRTRVRFPGISSRSYEHPADRSALVAMRSLSGFDAVLRRLAGMFRERSLRLMFLATAVRAGENQFRDLHELVRDAAYTLDLPEVPELYVVQDPRVQASTLGIDRPFIVLTSGLVDLMDAEELRAVVGHEVGHILSGHAVYRTMLFHLTRLTTRSQWLPLGYWGLRAVVAALEEWQRKSELSCDRAGLLVGQDLDAALRALMKSAGGGRLREMNTEAFLAQAAEYESSGDLRDGVLKLLNLQGQTWPFAVLRVAELKRWADRRILAGTYPRRADDPNAKVFDEVKATASAYSESMRRSTDPLFSVMRDLASDAASAGEKIFSRFGGRPGGGTGSGGDGGSGGNPPNGGTAT